MARSLVAWGACLAAATLARGAGAAEAAGGPEVPRLSVTGRGKVLARPDVAEIGVVVATRGETAREAMRANDEAIKALAESLKDRGVTAEDVQSVHVSVDARYTHQRLDGPPAGAGPTEFVPKLVGYQVSNTVRVTARALGKLGPILDRLTEGGEHQLCGVAFRFGDHEALLDQARRRAMADARHKAELLAGAAEMVLDSPVSIHEVAGPAAANRQPPLPGLGRGAGAATDVAAPADAREQEVSSTVEVVYKIRSPKG